jgi:transcriptional regulatory protein LevR
MAHSNKIDLNAKIRDYEQFANDVLKAELQKTVEQRAKCQLEVDELEELRRNVQQLQQQQEVSRTSNASLLQLCGSFHTLCITGSGSACSSCPMMASSSRKSCMARDA